jgi:hypothetical protein
MCQDKNGTENIHWGICKISLVVLLQKASFPEILNLFTLSPSLLLSASVV